MIVVGTVPGTTVVDNLPPRSFTINTNNINPLVWYY